jgi:hypothetical protein
VAELVFGLWLEIDGALQPIIGHRGVAALYNRSLAVTSAAHRWMDVCRPGQLDAVDPTALRAALAQQGADRAGAGAHALFAAFHGLLASLVGASLTERLLLSVGSHPPAIPPAQDLKS